MKVVNIITPPKTKLPLSSAVCAALDTPLRSLVQTDPSAQAVQGTTESGTLLVSDAAIALALAASGGLLPDAPAGAPLSQTLSVFHWAGAAAGPGSSQDAALRSLEAALAAGAFPSSVLAMALVTESLASAGAAPIDPGLYPLTLAYIDAAADAGLRPAMSLKMDAAKWASLQFRQVALLDAVDALKAKFDALAADGPDAPAADCETGPMPVRHVEQTVTPMYTRFQGLCADLGLASSRLVRVAPEYYDCPLAWRRDVLGAESVDQLCKTIVFVNKKAVAGVTDCSNRNNSKYYAAVVQYTHKIQTQDLQRFVASLNPGIGKKRFHFRLVPEDESAILTGYGHNAVSPLGLATDIPIILSQSIADLPQREFWLGAGEVDLKIACNVDEFVSATNCFVADFTSPKDDVC